MIQLHIKPADNAKTKQVPGGHVPPGWPWKSAFKSLYYLNNGSFCEMAAKSTFIKKELTTYEEWRITTYKKSSCHKMSFLIIHRHIAVNPNLFLEFGTQMWGTSGELFTWGVTCLLVTHDTSCSFPQVICEPPGHSTKSSWKIINTRDHTLLSGPFAISSKVEYVGLTYSLKACPFPERQSLCM